jgi:hypothetical protein
MEEVYLPDAITIELHYLLKTYKEDEQSLDPILDLLHQKHYTENATLGVLHYRAVDRSYTLHGLSS